MFCPHCGKVCDLQANFCPACGKPLFSAAQAASQTRIVRPRYPRLIAGVCSGFALHYGWDVVVTRILFAVLTVFTFPLCVVVYIAAWLILPDAQYQLPVSAR